MEFHDMGTHPLCYVGVYCRQDIVYWPLSALLVCCCNWSPFFLIFTDLSSAVRPKRRPRYRGAESGLVIGRRFACEICHKSFTRRDTLTGHIKNLHGELQGPFCCLKCGQLSKNKKSLMTHMYDKHGGQR
jgi:uncharacterized C2H2 Zn-finger protein